MRTKSDSILALVVGLAALSAACGDTVAPEERAPDPIAELTARVNSYRASVGCPSLSWHDPLADVAQEHSEDMVRRSFFGHVNPDGESPFDRMRAAGIRWSGPAGENLAAFVEDPATVLDRWLRSPGHRANLNDCRYRHHAVGLSQGHWTHLFVSRPEG